MSDPLTGRPTLAPAKPAPSALPLSDSTPIDMSVNSDVGVVRKANEDCFLVIEPDDPALLTSRGRLAVVADGMGGAVGGSTASRMVVETIRDTYYAELAADPHQALLGAVHTANGAVHSYAQQHPEYRGMGSTCTALAICQGHALIAHVGDTRCYLIRDHRILQLTDDHSKVAQMVRDGFLTPEQAESHPEKNVILRSMGPKPQVQVDLVPPVALHVGDRIVMTSDGLTGLVADREILEIVEQFDSKKSIESLIALANKRGGPDNITVHNIRIGDARKTLPPAVAGSLAPVSKAPANDPDESPLPPPRRISPILIGVGVVLLGVVATSAYLMGKTESKATGKAESDSAADATVGQPRDAAPLKPATLANDRATAAARKPPQPTPLQGAAHDGEALNPQRELCNLTRAEADALISPQAKRKAVKTVVDMTACPAAFDHLIEAMEREFETGAPDTDVAAVQFLVYCSARYQRDVMKLDNGNADGIPGRRTVKALSKEQTWEDWKKNPGCKVVLDVLDGTTRRLAVERRRTKNEAKEQRSLHAAADKAEDELKAAEGEARAASAIAKSAEKAVKEAKERYDRAEANAKEAESAFKLAEEKATKATIAASKAEPTKKKELEKTAAAEKKAASSAKGKAGKARTEAGGKKTAYEALRKKAEEAATKAQAAKDAVVKARLKATKARSEAK